MAVTGNFYNTLEFGNINSGDYGVYITGTGVYNAPARAVEMVSVPGRNGDVPIDMGHWDNIEVTYKCGLFGIDQSEMGEALMEFRNAIASQIGYQRLSDSYNPNEFRLGLFMAGLEFDAVSRNRAGEFELKFNCKPQRFLTDGEEMIDIRTDWSDLKTASGEVVTFEVADDAAANYTQFKSLVADIEPQQDLNGYDHPWVGGAGKNKLQNTLASQTLNGVTLTVNDDGTMATSGTATGNISSLYFSQNVELLPSTNYILSGCPSGGTQNTYRLVLFINGEQTVIDYGNEASFTTPETITSAKAYPIILNGTNMDGKVFKPMIRLASVTDATFEPYENLCPISGWDSVEVVVSPTTSAEDGTTHTATFGETVYGGTVDLVSGVLTVDRAMVDLGTLDYIYLTDYDCPRFWSPLPLLKKNANGAFYGGSILSSNYESVPQTETHYSQYFQVLAGIDKVITSYTTGGGAPGITIRDTAYTTATDFKTAMNGVQLVYELAEPRTIQLDSQTINTLVGVNNVWANSGDVTLEYGVRPGVLINPTQYESQPLIEIAGVGSVEINDYTIDITNDPIGEVELAGERNIDPWYSDRTSFDKVETYDLSGTLPLLNDGDSFKVSSMVMTTKWGTSNYTFEITQQPANGTAAREDTTEANRTLVVARINPLEFVKGTPAEYTEAFQVIVSDTAPPVYATLTITLGAVVAYDGENTLTVTRTRTYTASGTISYYGDYGTIGAIVGDSSKPVYSGGEVTIDAETGDAYRLEGGTYISLNKYVQLGAELPTLRPGANVITYDDAITSLKIAPRWWRL